MPTRMDRYNSENNDCGSRTDKNQQLYKELYSNKTYTEFTNTVKDNVVDLNAINNLDIKKRSEYNRTKLRYDITDNNESKEERQISKIYKSILNSDIENKNYNVNDILEDAKKNRKEDDESEKQKRIKNAEYSILNDLSQEKIKEYHDRKEKGITKEEEENLEELIHTITSNSLKKKIDDQLLADLLPNDDEIEKTSTSLLDELATGTIDEIDDDTKEEIKTTKDLEKGLDKSFFTKSMDLKREDLILDGDEDTSFVDEKGNILKKILIIILVLVVLGAIGFAIYKII